LQALFEFQTQVALLTGMEVANASMYDGSTACAEAVVMAHRVARGKKSKAILAPGLHPHYAAATQTLASTLNIKIDERECRMGRDGHVINHIDDDTACVVVQSPNVFGEIVDLRPIAEKAHAHKALLIAPRLPRRGNKARILLSAKAKVSALVWPLVVRMSVSLLAARNSCGKCQGGSAAKPWMPMVIEAQHIRREKATSNICTNSGLCCLAFTIHMSLLGDAGIQKLATLNHEKACDRISGAEVMNETFFNEFAVKLNRPAVDVVDAMVEKGVIAGVPLSRLAPDADETLLLVCATETSSDEDIAAFGTALKEVLS